MNARFLNRPAGAVSPAAPDDMIPARDERAVLPDRACCCPARPLFLVVMPPTAARPHRTDLLLCGHHYNASRTVLAAAGAAVTELPA